MSDTPTDPGAELVKALDMQLKAASAMRDYSTEFADANPDNPHAQNFRVECRKAKTALIEARLSFRNAMGYTARDAREGAERELTGRQP